MLYTSPHPEIHPSNPSTYSTEGATSVFDVLLDKDQQGSDVQTQHQIYIWMCLLSPPNMQAANHPVELVCQHIFHFHTCLHFHHLVTFVYFPIADGIIGLNCAATESRQSINLHVVIFLLNCHNYVENLIVLWNIRLSGANGQKSPMNKIEWTVTVQKSSLTTKTLGLCLKYVLHSRKYCFQQNRSLKTPPKSTIRPWLQPTDHRVSFDSFKTIFQFTLLWFFQNLSLGQFCFSVVEVVGCLFQLCSCTFSLAWELADPTWSLCHPRMSAIQATRFLPPLQFKFSAAAVFVKAPPRGPQTPSPAPRGSHNRTILGGLDPCTKINWTPARRLAPKTISRQNAEDGRASFAGGGLFWFVCKLEVGVHLKCHWAAQQLFLSNLIKLTVRIGISSIALALALAFK